jgi:hypothetical protein
VVLHSHLIHSPARRHRVPTASSTVRPPGPDPRTRPAAPPLSPGDHSAATGPRNPQAATVRAA